MSALAHSRRLARIDLERTVRKHTDWRGSSSAIIGAVVYAILTVALTAGGGYLAYRAGTELAGLAGDPVFEQFSPIDVGRGLLAVIWLVLVVIFLVRAVGQRGTLAQPEGVLTVVSTREALGGVLLAEYAFLLLWTALPSVGVGAGLALGSGVAWPALTVPIAVSMAGLAAVAVGYPVGLGVRHVATRFPFVARHKSAILVAVFVAYFAAITTGTVNEVIVALFEPMQRSPIGWFADLLFAGTPGIGASPIRAVAGVAVAASLTIVAVVVGTWVADRHWFSDPALAGEAPGETDAGDAAPGLERRLEGVLGVATAALVVLSWRRAIRAPLKLLYAFYPLLVLAGIGAEILQTGDVPAYLPFAVLVLLAWSAGVVFTLNPLGDQGAALASTLLSRVDGRQFVHAHLLAGLAVAVPVGTAATAAVALVSPVDDRTALALIAGTPVVMVLAAGLSVGVGTAFPRFEAVNVTRSMKTVVPSRWAFILFSVYLGLTTAAGAVLYSEPARRLAAGLLSWALPFGLSVDPEGLFAVAAAVAAIAVLLPLASYRFAVRRFDAYTLA